jgi:hypothetical protein
MPRRHARHMGGQKKGPACAGQGVQQRCECYAPAGQKERRGLAAPEVRKMTMAEATPPWRACRSTLGHLAAEHPRPLAVESYASLDADHTHVGRHRRDGGDHLSCLLTRQRPKARKDNCAAVNRAVAVAKRNRAVPSYPCPMRTALAREDTTTAQHDDSTAAAVTA